MLKRCFIFGMINLLIHCGMYGQAVDKAELEKMLKTGNEEIVKAINNNVKELKEVIQVSVKPASLPAQTIKPNATVSIIIAFLPIVFFLLIILVLLFKSKRNDITLREILLDKDMQITLKKEEAKVAIANSAAIQATANAVAARAQAFQARGVLPQADTDIPAPVSPADQASDSKAGEQQSVSRLIALVSGVTTVALVACIASFYMYRWFLGDSNPDIGNLSTILYGLGLGLVPYGFNKVAAALK